MLDIHAHHVYAGAKVGLTKPVTTCLGCVRWTPGGNGRRISRWRYTGHAGGFLLAGVLTVLLQEFDPIRAALASAWAPLLMLVAGVPMYVCAAAATPMIAVLVSEGLSPGAGLVFLLAGPATNAATIVLLMKILGRRAVVVYLVAIMVCALGFGFLLDATYGWIGLQPVMLTRADDCCTQPSVVDISAAFVLLALTVTGISRVTAKRLSGL